jgi:alcohol dehydrogenase
VKITGAVLERSGASRPYRASKPLRIVDLDLDDPHQGEVRIRIEAAGVCHSDLSVIDGARPRPLPMLLGHEAAGVVDALGDGVTDLRMGQRVVMTFLPRCGECAACATEGRLPCERGSASNAAGELLGGGTRLSRTGVPVLHHLGASAFATHAVVDRRSIVPVDDDIPPDVAALMGCAVLTGGGALINAGRPEPGDGVIIVGLGGVGMAALLTARALGHEVIAVDRVPSKLALAVELGASEAMTPEAAVSAGVRVPVVLEAAGHPDAFQTAFELTAPGGRTVTVGLPASHHRAAVPLAAVTAEARTIVGSYLGSAVPARDIPVFADMWRSGSLPVERLISGSIGLDEVNDAMDQLADGLAVRQVIGFG